MWSHYADNGKGFAIEYDEGGLLPIINSKKEKLNYEYRELTGIFLGDFQLNLRVIML